MKLGTTIQDIRRERNMTQEEFGELFHVTRQAVSNWENEKTYPDLITLIEISDMFDVSLDSMLKEDKNMTEKLNKDIKSSKRLKIALVIIIVMAVLMTTFYYGMTKEHYVPYEDADIKIENNSITAKEYCLYSYITPNGEAEFYWLAKNKIDDFKDGRRVMLNLDKDSRTSTIETDDGETLETKTVKEVYYLPEDYAMKMKKASRTGEGFWYDGDGEQNDALLEEVKNASTLIWKED